MTEMHTQKLIEAERLRRKAERQKGAEQQLREVHHAYSKGKASAANESLMKLNLSPGFVNEIMQNAASQIALKICAANEDRNRAAASMAFKFFVDAFLRQPWDLRGAEAEARARIDHENVTFEFRIPAIDLKQQFSRKELFVLNNLKFESKS